MIPGGDYEAMIKAITFLERCALGVAIFAVVAILITCII